MQLIGVALILTVLLLAGLWFWYMKNRSGVMAREVDNVQVFDIMVKGVYNPSVIEAKLGKPIKINFNRQESDSCSQFVNFPDFKIRKELPENQIVAVELNPTKAGEFVFLCDMGMYQGKLIIK
ncbi:MAG: cupredoxin domain-containing protein [Candidatus Buchananbacteria bacterium]|nr:cupredoxin domain-containing protein [Candidatus Buchananbacteria bacterium]